MQVQSVKANRFGFVFQLDLTLLQSVCGVCAGANIERPHTVHIQSIYSLYLDYGLFNLQPRDLKILSTRRLQRVAANQKLVTGGGDYKSFTFKESLMELNNLCSHSGSLHFSQAKLIKDFDRGLKCSVPSSPSLASLALSTLKLLVLNAFEAFANAYDAFKDRDDPFCWGVSGFTHQPLITCRDCN